MAAVSLILVGFRQIIPDLVTIILANALIYSGLFLLYLGFTCFAEKKVRKEFHIAVGVLIVFILFPIFTYIYPNVSARIIMISCGSFLLYFKCPNCFQKSPPYSKQSKYTAYGIPCSDGISFCVTGSVLPYTGKPQQ